MTTHFDAWIEAVQQEVVQTARAGVRRAWVGIFLYAVSTGVSLIILAVQFHPRLVLAPVLQAGFMIAGILGAASGAFGVWRGIELRQVWLTYLRTQTNLITRLRSEGVHDDTI